MASKWPSPQDFNEAIQSPHCFRDESLRAGSLATNALGLPRVESGNFANVYKVRCIDGEWAVRCFTHHVPDNEARYDLLSDFILHDDLIYTVTFDFQREGIKLGKSSYPIVKMEWVHGDHLLSWIDKHIEEPQAITSLADSFLNMIRQLQAAGIAHGDLQHGNIIIVDNDFRLIDYDGMYVPAMAGMPSNELGHPNYQHPLRDKLHFGPYLDNFSAWVIFTSLQMIARDASLWMDIGRENGETILFTKSDFADPTQSNTFQLLLRHGNEDIRKSASSIIELIQLSPEQVPPPAVAHEHLALAAVKRPSFFDKIINRAVRKFKKRKPQQVARPAIIAPTPTADWIKDWIQENPVELQKPKQPEQALKEPPLASPLQAGAVDRDKNPLAGPYKMREYEVARLLYEALSYARLHKFHDAKASLGAAQDAIRARGASPKLVIKSLLTEASILAKEADSHADQHRFHEAQMMYEKAIKIMQVLKNRRQGKPELADDLTHAGYLWELSSIFREMNEPVKEHGALEEALNILAPHPTAKRELNRIRKRLGLGIT
jgi:hypothetical protein